MTDSRGWFARAVCITACLVTLLGAPPAKAEPVACQADVRGEFRRDEVYDQYVDKVFVVNITSSEACAKVYFDLVTTERLFNGEVITSTHREWRKVTAEPSKASPVKYRIARDSSLVKWEIKLSRCVVCGTE